MGASKKEALERNDVRYGGRTGDDGVWQQLYEGSYWVQDRDDPSKWQLAPEKKSAEAEKAAQERSWSEDATKAWRKAEEAPKAKARAKPPRP